MKARLVPDGYDPTQQEFPLRGPTLRGCLVKLGCLGSITAIAAVVGIMIVVAASAQSQEEAANVPTVAPTWTPEASPEVSPTPITIYLAGTPYPTYTPYPEVPVEINLRMITPTFPPAPAQMTVEIVAPSLRVRAAPSVKSEQLGLLSKGGRIVVDTISFDGYWLGFSYWGSRAWIGSDSSLVKIVEGQKRGLSITGVTYESTQVPVSQASPSAAPTAAFKERE